MNSLPLTRDVTCFRLEEEMSDEHSHYQDSVKHLWRCFCNDSSRINVEAPTGDVLLKKVFLRISQNSHETACARISFLIKLRTDPCNFIKKETLTQVFSCEFCEIFKNSFFYISYFLIRAVKVVSCKCNKVQ